MNPRKIRTRTSTRRGATEYFTQTEDDNDEDSMEEYECLIISVPHQSQVWQTCRIRLQTSRSGFTFCPVKGQTSVLIHEVMEWKRSMEAGVQPCLICSAVSEGDHSLLTLLQLGRRRVQSQRVPVVPALSQDQSTCGSCPMTGSECLLWWNEQAVPGTHLLKVSNRINEFHFARFTQVILLITYSHSDLTKISLKTTFT